MTEEIQFLVDDLEEQNKKELERLLKIMEHPLMERDTYILWKFTRALMKAAKEKKWLEEKKDSESIKITSDEQHTVEVKHDEISIVNDEGNKDMTLKFSKDSPTGLFIPEMPDAPKPGIFGKQEDIRITNNKRYPIVFDRETNKGLVYAEINDNEYRLIEPNLTPKDEEILKTISKKYGSKIGKLAADNKKLSEIVEKMAKKEGINFDNIYFVNMRYYLMRDNMFTGKAEALMHDEKISKIECDGANLKIKVDYNGIPLEMEMKLNADEINSMMEKMAEITKTKINKKNPVVAMNINGFKMTGISGENPSFTLTRL